MNRKTIQIEFFGQKIMMKSGSDQAIVDEALDLATLKIADAKKRTKGAAPHHVALLALMDLAEEYVRAKHRAVDHRNEFLEKSAKLFELVQTDSH